MRLCRILLDEMTLIAFHADDEVIPLMQAAEAYADETGSDLGMTSSEDLLDYLPPDGVSFASAKILDAWVHALEPATREALAIPIDDVQRLVPIANPPKLLLLAGNYAEHVVERGGTSAEREQTFPYVFMKPAASTLTNPGDPVVLPRVSPDCIDWECELGVVIGRVCKNVEESEALEFVAGYTVVIDISDRKFRPNPGRVARERDKFFDWLHGKWHDTFCPMGPCVLSSDAVNPQKLAITLSVNGDVKQDSSTAKMVFPVAAIVSFLSNLMTLEPGDVISTGTPSGVGSSTNTYLRPGDVVSATIEGIGTLENPVVAEE
jgi:2,4-didehydro-3-deoxy-L-rhamnonate hydrolase